MDQDGGGEEGESKGKVRGGELQGCKVAWKRMYKKMSQYINIDLIGHFLTCHFIRHITIVKR